MRQHLYNCNLPSLTSSVTDTQHGATVIKITLYLSRFPKVIIIVLILYCTSSHMLGHVTSPTNGQLYIIKT